MVSNTSFSIGRISHYFRLFRDITLRFCASFFLLVICARTGVADDYGYSQRQARETTEHTSKASTGRAQTDNSANYFWDTHGNASCQQMVFGLDSLDGYGHTITTGDVNNDGVQDLLVAADADDGPTNGRTNCGAIYIFYGGVKLNDSLPASSADVIIYGASTGDGYGTAMVCADVNDDNIDDIILGTHSGDGFNNAYLSTGEVAIIFGGASIPPVIDLISTSPDVMIWGQTTSAGSRKNQAGTNLAVGDINGDSIDDILIHSHGGDTPAGGTVDVGLNFVIFGRTTWNTDLHLDSDYDVLLVGVDQMDAAYEIGGTVYRGTNILSAGDINCDGYDDICMVFAGGDGLGNAFSQSGECRVVFGSATLSGIINLSTDTDLLIVNEDANDLMLFVNTFDVNNDLCDDLIWTSRHADGPLNVREGTGELGVLYGAPVLAPTIQVESGANLLISGRDIDDRMFAVCGADMNGDGKTELIFSAYRADGPDNSFPESGELLIFTRPDTLPSRIDLANVPVDAKIFGSVTDLAIGLHSTKCGDVTGDGVPDLLVGTTFGLNTALIETGHMRVIDGASFWSGDDDLDAVTNVCDNCIEDYNPMQVDTDADGIGDVCDCCLNGGNVDNIVGGGGPINVNDVTYLVAFLFQGGTAPPCEAQANVDGVIGPGGPIDVSDLTYLVAFLFQGGPPPPPCI